MNQNSFISLKIGKKTIFTHSLSLLNQISTTINRRNIIEKNNQNHILNNLDIIPKFIQIK